MTIDEIISKLTENLDSIFITTESKALLASIMTYLNQCKKDTTLGLRTSENWKERLRGEYLQLKDRRNKLHTTLVKNAAGTIQFKGNTPISLLIKQEEFMDAYLNILEMRAEYEGIEL